MKKAVLASLTLVVLVGVGSVNLVQAVPYIVIAAVVIVTILIALGKINVKTYPIYIFGLALALLWQTSMLGTFIVGVDIHTEYFVANRIISEGWNINWANNSNTSLIMAWVTPALAKIGIDPIWQFKLLFPMVCALSPVILYFAFKRLIGEKRAYFACLFFMTMPMFTMEVVSIVKSQWAYMFVALLVFFLTSDYKPRTKAIGISLTAIGTVLSHYAVATIIVPYLITILGVLAATNWGKLRSFIGKARLPLRYVTPAIVCAVAVYVLWFSVMANGAMIKTVFAMGSNIASVVGAVASSDGSTDMSDRSETAAGLMTSEGRIEDYLQLTNPVASNTYLDNQSPLVRAAIGLDFGLASGWGKVFRVFQYMTQLLMVVGFFFVMFNRKKYNFTAEYKASLIASFGLLAACIFIPFFTTALSPTRFYVVTLFFISPLLIIGLEEPLRRLIK